VISGALFILVVPLAVAGIVYILGRWRYLASVLSIATALVMGLAIITLPLDRPVMFWGGRELAMGKTVDILGRELGFTQGARWAMAFMFLVAAGLFLVAWASDAHVLLFSIGLSSLSLLCAALLIRPFIYAVLLLEIVAVLSAFSLQHEGQPPSRGSLLYLTLSALALPGLLVTHWLLERYVLTPNETSLVSAAAILVALSFALLLGVIPFHTWVIGIARDGMPFASAFVLTIGQSAVWVLLFSFLDTYPWLNGYLRGSSIVLSLGVAMALLGGALAAGQRRLGPLTGYAALADTGCILVAFGIDTRTSLSLVLLALLVRPIGLVLMAAGLARLTKWGRDGSLARLRGVGWKEPLGMAAYVFGSLSLAGVPGSAGFVWRWALYWNLAAQNLAQATLLLLGSLGVLIGLFRMLAVTLDRSVQSGEGRADAGARTNWLNSTVVVLAILGCVGVGIFPQAVAPLATRLADSFTLLVR